MTDDLARLLELEEGDDLATVVQKLHDALMTRELESHGDSERSAKRIFALLSAVNDAGVDGESLIRFGLTLATALPFIIDLAVGRVDEERSGAPWRRALGVRRPPKDLSSPHTFGPVVNRAMQSGLSVIISWIHHAPFDDILTMKPPTADVMTSFAESAGPDEEVCSQYLWMAERLSGQGLRQWARSSLDAEYAWRRGRQPAMIPTAALIDVDFNVEDLAMEIADRVASEREGTDNPLLDHVKEKAVAFLRQGRYSDAAALFEFVGDHAGMRKNDCLNNRGFCWIPTDPKRALYFLEQAAQRGYRPAAVNAFNQMCCAGALHDYPNFRAVSENFWSELFDERPVRATLWFRDDDVWSLRQVPDARICVAELALAQAQSEGWPQRVERWQLRLDALRDDQQHFV